MTPLAVVLVIGLAAVGYGITLRVRAHLRDQRGYGRHAATRTPTYTRNGWQPTPTRRAAR